MEMSDTIDEQAEITLANRAYVATPIEADDSIKPKSLWFARGWLACARTKQPIIDAQAKEIARLKEWLSWFSRNSIIEADCPEDQYINAPLEECADMALSGISLSDRLAEERKLEHRYLKPTEPKT